jgi:hypothetical protein
MGCLVVRCGSSYGWNATVRVCLAGSQEVRTVPLHIWDKFKTAAEAALNREVALLVFYNGDVPQRRRRGVMHKLHTVHSIGVAELLLQGGHVSLHGSPVGVVKEGASAGAGA